MNNYLELSDIHKDALLELGNIGTGNALTSLSQLVDHPVKMDLPGIRIVELASLPDLIDCQTSNNAGVVIEVHGDLECVVAFLLNEEFTKVLAEELTGEPLKDIMDMNSMQESAIREVGNIMCNSYLNALAAMLQADLSVSVPNLKLGSCEEVLSTFSHQYVDDVPEILFIENTFHCLDQEYVSYILLHPKFDSLRKILDKIEL